MMLETFLQSIYLIQIYNKYNLKSIHKDKIRTISLTRNKNKNKKMINKTMRKKWILRNIESIET